MRSRAPWSRSWARSEDRALPDRPVATGLRSATALPRDDRAVRLAEELGYDSVWLTEHHFTRHGIAAIAPCCSPTSRPVQAVSSGTAVLVLPFHDPIRLAEQIALVDHLSDGRLDIGIGRGYQL